MKKYKQLFVAAGIMLGCFLVHFLILVLGFDIYREYFFYIYLFVFTAFLISILALQVLEKTQKEQLGYYFLAIITIKLGAALIFLKKADGHEEQAFRISLMILYLISLSLITWYASQKLLNSTK